MKNETSKKIKTIKTIEKGESIMTEQLEIEEVETTETAEKYIPADELAESERIMQGRTMYTIDKDFMIVETKTVRCNPSSYSYEALELLLKNNKELLDSYFNDDENNYGIGFYACGFNGTAQQEFIQAWADNGVRVF